MLLSFTGLRKKYNMDVKGIIHIGGHYGEEIDEYVRNGIQEIVIFEPLSDSFDILCENIQELNANIIAHQVALGPEETTATMYVSDNEKQSSSLLKPKVHITHHPHVKFPETEDVEVKVLDDFDYTKYNFINMDVQGYELEVLKGATETLKHVDYVYCEVNRDEVYEGNAYVEELDEFLSAYGMERVETSWEGQIWGDALYIKKV
jgi:FkbM family methyltransferase